MKRRVTEAGAAPCAAAPAEKYLSNYLKIIPIDESKYNLIYSKENTELIDAGAMPLITVALALTVA